MTYYKIVWGPVEQVIPAASEGDAWVAFARVHEDALRCPNTYKREISIVEAPPKNADKPAAKAGKGR